MADLREKKLAQITRSIDTREEKEHAEDLNIFERMLRGTREGIIGCLYVMAKDTRANTFLTVLFMVISSAQIAAIATPEAIDPDIYINPLLKPIYAIFKAFSVNNYDFLVPAVTIPIAVGLVAVMALNVAYVGYAWVYQTFRHTWAIRLLRVVSVFLANVLYIPILYVFTSALTCPPDLSESACAAVRPVVIIMLLFFVPFSLANTATFYDPMLMSASPTAMPHSRVALMHQLIRTVLAILAGALPVSIRDNPESALVVMHFWTALVTLSSLFLVFTYVWIQPYYNGRINLLQAQLSGVIFWAAASMFFNGMLTSYDGNDGYHAIFFFVGLILLIPMVYLIMVWRCHTLLEEASRKNIVGSSASMGAMEVELKIRMLLFASRKRMKRSVTSLGRSGDDLDEDVLKDASSMYSDAVSRLTEDSLVCMLQAQFLLYVLKQPLLARRALLLAENRNPAAYQRFIMFKMRKHLEENSFQSSDIQEFVTAEKHRQSSAFYDRRCCVLLVEFWKGLGQADVDVVNIRNLADQIAESASLAQESYQKLIKLRPNDADIHTTYAGFVDAISNNPEEAKKLRRKADDVRSRQAKIKSSGAFTDGSGKTIDHDDGILTVDATSGMDCGRIEAANMQIGRIFNNASENLMGRNISSVLLPPFADSFDEIVAEFLETGAQTYFEKSFASYVRLDSENRLLPCNICLKPFTSDGVNFKIYICFRERRISESSGQEVVIVNPENNSLLGFTRRVYSHFTQLFNHTDDDVVGSIDNLALKDLIPNYDTRKALFARPQGAPLFEPGSVGANAEEELGLQPATVHLGSEHLHGPDSPPLDMLMFTFKDGNTPLMRSPASKYHLPFGGDNASPGAVSLPLTNDSQDAPAETGLSSSLRLPAVGEDEENDAERAALHADFFGRSEDTTGLGSISDKREGKLSVPVKEETAVMMSKSENAPSQAESSATSSMIRRVMLANMDKSLDPSLVRFQRLYLYFTLLSMAAVIAMYVYRNKYLDFAYKQGKEFTPWAEAGLRRSMAIEISYLAHCLVLIGQGIELPAYYTEPVVRKKLKTAAKKLQTLDEDLYLNRFSYHDKLFDYYMFPKVTMRRRILGSIETEGLAMHDAVVLMASQAELASTTPIEELTKDSALVWFLLHNIEPLAAKGQTSFLEGLNHTVFLLTNESQGNMQTLNLTLAIVAGCVVVLFAILLLILLLPMVRRIDNNKISVFRELVGMPPAVFGVVGKRYAERLSTVHDQVHDSVAVDDEQPKTKAATPRKAAVGEDLLEPVAAGPATKGKVVKGKVGVAGKHGAAAGGKVAGGKDRAQGHVHDELRQTSNRCKIMSKMSIGLLLNIFYFGAIIALAQYTAIIVRDAPYENNFSGLRRAQLRLAHHHLRMYATGSTDPDSEFGVSWNVTVEKHLLELHDIQRALIYGDPERKLHGALGTSSPDPNQETLLFKDGCQYFQSPTFGPGVPECSTYDNGVMKNGLHQAYQYYIDEARVVFDDIKAYNAGNGTKTYADIESLSKVLKWENYDKLHMLEEFYLTGLIAKSVLFYSAHATDTIDRSETIMLAAMLVLLSSVLAVYIFIVQRLVLNLDNEVKRTRSLLLMVPDDVLQTLPSLRRFLVKEVLGNNSGNSKHL